MRMAASSLCACGCKAHTYQGTRRRAATGRTVQPQAWLPICSCALSYRGPSSLCSMHRVCICHHNATHHGQCGRSALSLRPPRPVEQALGHDAGWCGQGHKVSALYLHLRQTLHQPCSCQTQMQHVCARLQNQPIMSVRPSGAVHVCLDV